MNPIVPYMWLYPWKLLFGLTARGDICTICLRPGHTASSCKHSKRVEP